MGTIGMRPGDVVRLIESYGEQQLVYNALVAGFTMDADLRGTHGEPAITACFVATRAANRLQNGSLPTLTVTRVVHISHRDFVDGFEELGYEELPGAIGGPRS